MFVIFSIFFLAIFLYGAKWCKGWNDNYLGKDQANAIKGFFILFLTIGHIILLVLYANDLYPVNLGNRIELSLHHRMNQLVVVMFFFFSGYGVSESIKKFADSQTGGYIKLIPKRRILNTWINYAVGIIIYIVLTPLTGKELYAQDIPLYFLCQKSIGAPTWYIFVIILCYMTTWVAGMFFNKSRRLFVVAHTVLIILVATILYFFKEDWWYDTILCYAFGLIYSQYIGEFEKRIKKNWFLSLIFTVCVFLILYIVTYSTAVPWLISFNMLAISFALLIIIAGMRIKVGNKCINWCGVHLFPIYMFQGLIYQILFNIGGESHLLVSYSPFVYAAISLVLTILLANYYPKWEIKMR